jgi:hypothetical protein
MDEETFNMMAQKRIVYQIPGMEWVKVRRNITYKTVDEYVMNHPTGLHGFDLLNDDARSREIIRATLEFVKTHLSGNL